MSAFHTRAPSTSACAAAEQPRAAGSCDALRLSGRPTRYVCICGERARAGAGGSEGGARVILGGRARVARARGRVFRRSGGSGARLMMRRSAGGPPAVNLPSLSRSRAATPTAARPRRTPTRLGRVVVVHAHLGGRDGDGDRGDILTGASVARAPRARARARARAPSAPTHREQPVAGRRPHLEHRHRRRALVLAVAARPAAAARWEREAALPRAGPPARVARSPPPRSPSRAPGRGGRRALGARALGAAQARDGSGARRASRPSVASFVRGSLSELTSPVAARDQHVLVVLRRATARVLSERRGRGGRRESALRRLRTVSEISPGSTSASSVHLNSSAMLQPRLLLLRRERDRARRAQLVRGQPGAGRARAEPARRRRVARRRSRTSGPRFRSSSAAGSSAHVSSAPSAPGYRSSSRSMRGVVRAARPTT